MSQIKIIEGIPSHVELDVNRLLSEGWRRSGNLFHRTVDGNNIAVQGLYKGDESQPPVSVYVFRLYTTGLFDPDGIPGCIYHNNIKSVRDRIKPFTQQFLVKIRAESVGKAGIIVEGELELQLPTYDDQRDFHVVYVKEELHYV